MSSDPDRKLYDLTPTIDGGLQVFPGDTPPTREVLLDLARGDHLTLSSLHATVHLGAHADAPSHYDRDGGDMASQSLDRYLGRCRLVRAETPAGERVAADRLPEGELGERLLVATNSYPDPRRSIGEGFAGLQPEFVTECARRGVRLIGVDMPSVDLVDAKHLTAHAACREHGILILEGLLLNEIPEGEYELIALPLKLAGFDGSPVRAVLRTL
ncbi:MAG: cyclase family protein [Acidobacteriota bacterium]|nr:cyclase family protein [Acidobacteriota bacterium]MDH3785574.1 cyclase family protein [Acidobacteriota bacterium]